MLRNIGTILLALGFLALAGAWYITDPFANDANIGAGGLIFLGRPAGAAGLLILIVDAIYRAVQRRNNRTV
jgi:hypothetical protein